MATIIGILLWSLIPGFIARKKGRNFWAYYFLSWAISPLITMIITICLKDLTKEKAEETVVAGNTEERNNQNKVEDCLAINSSNRICPSCGYEILEDSAFCSNCGNKIEG